MADLVTFKSREWIYKKDTNGNVRQWKMEIAQDGDRAFHRALSGVVGGSIVESEWKETFPKNEGKKNATTALTQAEAEVESKYTDRLTKGYHRHIDDAGKGTFHFKPMLAAKYEDRPIDFTERVYSQPKLDGIRCIARADGLWTRQGKPIVSCPHVFEALAPLFEAHPDAIFDGELYNHELKDDFNTITSLVRKTKPTDDDIEECRRMVQYHIYDALLGDDPDLPFINRHWDLVNEFNLIYPTWNIEKIIDLVLTFSADKQEVLDELYGEYLEQGYEGQMIRYNLPYENKRSKSLIKRKEFLDAEFEVVEVLEGEGNWSGAVKRFVVKLPDGQTCQAGVRGTYKDLVKLLHSPCPDWATVRFQNYTPDGLLRFPVVVDYGYGKRED